MNDFCRGLVRVEVILDGESEPRDNNHAFLECWTDDNTMGAYQPIKLDLSLPFLTGDHFFSNRNCSCSLTPVL